ncbi:hypothetical protein EAI_09320 [Harpegnathos saltator]|uniref:Uncharacterized protein n=1 Tax=Harpegnathos saltator TaxID=610380 RepID=E2B3U3_HARSA|nr:hypothetical protein EAI_09320 [Harpegnathos saltator]
MRRTDHDGHAARQGPPPFRVLAASDGAYLSPVPPSSTPPPPPRAPEPYKVAPSTTSFGRAHRRSSFVILAESRPATPEADGASPPLPTGRVSPFRGRGFKGPPPRSTSRPQSPEAASAADGRRRGRVERRASVSQQNSPRRSLIPQPTYRQRSTSLTKANDHSPSPKIGRRVDSKTRLNVSNSRDRLNATNARSTPRLNDSRTRLNKSDSRSRTNLGEPRARFISNSTSNLSSNPTATRRQTMRMSTRLSPIQGTPTKPEKTTTTQPSLRGDRSRDSLKAATSAKTPRTSPQKNSVSSRRDHQNRNTSRERVVSPSKIPLKTARNGSFNTSSSSSSSNTGRFITMPEQASEAAKKTSKADRAVKEGRGDKQLGESVEIGQSAEASSREVQLNGDSSGQMDEVDLMDLLKQSSSHTIATSSERLVNTTTSTAVKPLVHVDANALLVERNDGSIASQPRERDATKSSTSPTSKDESPEPVSASQNAAPTSHRAAPTTDSQPARAHQAGNSGNEKRDSPVGAESTGGPHSKTGNQATRNVSRTNGEASTQQRSSNQSSANQRPVKNSQGNRGPKPNESSKVSEEPEATPTPSAEVKSGPAGGKAAGGRDAPANDRMSTLMESNDAKVARASEQVEAKNAAAMNSVNSVNTVNTVSNGATANSRRTTNSAAKSNDKHASFAAGAVNASVNASGAVLRARNENRGSDASLKSSTGVSTDSIESVRSTDTGVSVNTVRGVSSPREKTGVHMVKRQEIETLSGNIVCVEQNGEPA